MVLIREILNRIPNRNGDNTIGLIYGSPWGGYKVPQGEDLCFFRKKSMLPPGKGSGNLSAERMFP